MATKRGEEKKKGGLTSDEKLLPLRKEWRRFMNGLLRFSIECNSYLFYETDRCGCGCRVTLGTDRVIFKILHLMKSQSPVGASQ